MSLLRCVLLSLFLLSALFSASLLAQIPQHFEGLARTQVQYLNAQSKVLQVGSSPENLTLHLPPGQNLTRSLGDLRQQLINLPAITSADFTIDSLAGEPSAVNWKIEEARTLFPLLDLGGVQDNFYYLLGY